MARRYPQAKGTCRICGNKGKLDPHHIISQAQIIKRGLPESMFTDRGTCRNCAGTITT